MPQVSIQIANRTYELACGEGEEERVQELAAYVDEKVGELRKQLPGAPEIKLMVFASLLLAEESREARGVAKAAENARASATDSAETLATALEDLITARVDKMSQKGERRGLKARSGSIGAGSLRCPPRVPRLKVGRNSARCVVRLKPRGQ